MRDAAGDRGLTPDQAHVNRDLAQSQIQTRGYVITDPDSYFAANIHAVAVPFQSRELGDPVVFTCGAMPEALSVARMREEVGPKLLQTVRDLERMMGQSSGMSAHDL